MQKKDIFKYINRHYKFTEQELREIAVCGDFIFSKRIIFRLKRL